MGKVKTVRNIVVYLLLISAFLTTTCVVAAISDLKTGKVPNRLLLIALSMGGIVALLGGLIDGVWPWQENDVGWRFLSNIILAGVFAVGFFAADIWAPGDAKLFIAITLFYPPMLQTAPDGSIFPSLQIVVWMFLMGFLYLLVDYLFQGKKRQNTKYWKATFFKGTADILMQMVTMYGFSMLANSMTSTLLPIFYESNQTLCALIIIGCCYLLGKQPKCVMITVAVLSVIGIAFYPSARMLLYSFSFGSVFPWCVAILVGVLTRTMRESNYRVIAPEQLVTGMVLSAYTCTRFPEQNLLPQTRWIESRRSKLNQGQVNAVKNWSLRKKEPILIVRMIPFAPFIAAGTILEMLLGWLRLYR
jgi:Flp pilus assembly protein protease CpaA